jgi:hypothetical protein
MKKKKQINNFSIAHKLKNDKNQKLWRKQRKKRGFDDTELWNLHDTFYEFMIPRLEAFKNITMSYPSYETSESYEEKLNFIINSFKLRYALYEKPSVSFEDEKIINENAKKAAVLLGELWFDLWS